MKINVGTFTKAFQKISDLSSGEKTIPGVLMRIISDGGDNESAKLEMRYTNGHKAITETVSCVAEEDDYKNGHYFAVSYEKLKEAVEKCQPSGYIKVSDMQFKFGTTGVSASITIGVKQYMDIVNADGEVESTRDLGYKATDIKYIVVDTEDKNLDLKTAVLLRAPYDEIFEPSVITDKYNREELIDILTKTSPEKGKNLYISTKTHSAFVMNQVHVTVVPISKYPELSEDERNTLIADLDLSDTLTSDEKTAKINAAIEKSRHRVNYSLVIPQAIAKSIIAILNKSEAEEVELFTNGKFCNIIIEDAETDEKVGIWFEMAQQNKTQIGAVQGYLALGYKTYQLLFLRELLMNNLKSAASSAKNDKTQIAFEATTLENPTSALDLVITSNNFGASVSDKYSINPDGIVDPTGDLEGKRFSVSLKTLTEMLAQLKTERVAFDIELASDGRNCLRISEVDNTALQEEFVKSREKTRILCEQAGQPFDPATTPTPIDVKLEYRDRILKAKQYTLLSK